MATQPGIVIAIDRIRICLAKRSFPVIALFSQFVANNYFKPAAWHDAMSAALESSSAYAITAIAFDENRRANPNLITLTTHADANVRCVAAT